MPTTILDSILDSIHDSNHDSILNSILDSIHDSILDSILDSTLSSIVYSCSELMPEMKSKIIDRNVNVMEHAVKPIILKILLMILLQKILMMILWKITLMILWSQCDSQMYLTPWMLKEVFANSDLLPEINKNMNVNLSFITECSFRCFIESPRTPRSLERVSKKT